MVQRRMVRTSVSVIVIVALAIGAFVAATALIGPAVPAMGGASASALELTP